MILFYFFCYFFFITTLGLVVVRLLFGSEGDQYTPLSPIIGYAGHNLLFYLLILLTGNTHYSFISIIVLFLFCLFWIYSRKWKKELFVFFKGYYLLIGLFVFLICTFPVLVLGLKSYWITLSEDLFDGYAGAYLFINNEGWEMIPGSIRLQYSNLAFITTFIQNSYSFDAFVLQGVINIMLGSLGVFLFMHRSLGYDKKVATLGALLGIFSNLYFTTFINSHVGSLLFGCIMPGLLFIAFELEKSISYTVKEIAENFTFKHIIKWTFRPDLSRLIAQGNFALLLLLMLLLYFIVLCYTAPMYFFIGPFALYILLKNLKYILRNLLLILLFAGVTIFLFYYLNVVNQLIFWGAQKRVIDGVGKGRAWWIALEWEMIPIYWGMLMSNVTNVAFTMDKNRIFYNSKLLMNILYSLSFIYSLISLIGLIKIKRERGFFIIFVLLCGGFGMMLYRVGDPYFFYKFLYTTQFIVLLLFTSGLYYLYTKSGFRKKIAIAVLSIFIGFNLFYDVFTNASLIKEDFNENSKGYESIVEIPPALLEKTYLDIAKQHMHQLCDFFLEEAGLDYNKSISRAEYILVLKEHPDIYFNNVYADPAIAFENKYFLVFEKPRNYIAGVFTITQPEERPNSPTFRWVGDHLRVRGVSKDYQYLSMCYEVGLGFEFEPFLMTIRNNNQLVEEDIIAGVECKCLHLNESRYRFSFKYDKKGKRHLPYDERFLNFVLTNVGYSNTKYDFEILRVLNPEKDVIPTDVYNALQQDSLIENSVVLGNSWYPKEIDSMRWGATNMEFWVMNSTKDSIQVSIDIEPGPSLITLPLNIQILNEDNHIIASKRIGKRMISTLNLPLIKGRRYQAFKIKVLNLTQPLRNDPRHLNLRIFSIKTIDKQEITLK